MQTEIDYPNISSPLLGSQIIYATDEWFAAAENMLKDEPPVWKADLYTTYGKWMDGWETRRRRTEGHDWCLIKLGLPCIIKSIEVDTAFFTGNFSPKVKIQAFHFDETPAVVNQLLSVRQDSITSRPDEGRMGLSASKEENEIVESLQSQDWTTIVPLTPLGAGYEETRKTVFPISDRSKYSYLRVNMGPDGGIARIKVLGQVCVSTETLPHDLVLDLAAVEVGGVAVSWSNMHYGHPNHLLAPGRGSCMGDGWETARQPLRPPVYERGEDGLMVLPGCDWAVLRLGLPGLISSLEVDTHFYKGNYPESCLVEGCFMPDAPLDWFKTRPSSSLAPSPVEWRSLLPRSRLGPHAIHHFHLPSSESHHEESVALVQDCGPISHVRITIFPDGGIMRLRVRGKRMPDSRL